jgi:hypothetical protein
LMQKDLQGYFFYQFASCLSLKIIFISSISVKKNQ